MTTVKIEHIDTAVSKILKDMLKKNEKLVGKKIADMPRRFRNAALQFYPQVLNVRTGRLRQSFQEIAETIGDEEWRIGLKSDVEYAAIHEFGGKAGRNQSVTIREKKFFRTPITLVADEVLKELKEEIGF